jgi:hypothetical protein
MGYRGKIDEQNRARDLRADGWTMPEIASELGVSRSSVSLWTRDVEFTPRPRGSARRREPNALQRRKQDEIERMLAEGRHRIGDLSDRELLIAGTALYAGEGFKGKLGMANTNPQILLLFVTWLRRLFDVDEGRLRMTLYLHRDLDVDVATDYWSDLLRIPKDQFNKPYRAAADPSIRTTKHPMGCPRVTYTCTRTHRAVLGLMEALLSLPVHSGVAQLAEHATVNRVVESSSLSPGASR